MAPTSEPATTLKAFYFHEPFTENYWPDILEEIYKKKVYQQFLPKKKEGSICIDIGANVGLSAYYFAQYFSRVYAAEPAERHIRALSAMIKANGIKNITIVPMAISNKIGTTKFYHNPNQTMFSLENKVNNANDFEEVKTIDLQELFRIHNIDKVDLLKLDVEGHEGVVVNSEGFKKVADKIKVICGEWHAWASCSQENFQHALEDLGFEFRWRHDTSASVFEAVRV